MVYRLLIFKLCMIFIAGSAFAEQEDQLLPLPKQLAYKFKYLNMPIGKMFIHTRPEEGKLSMDAAMKVTGVAKLFSNQRYQLTLNVDGPHPDGHARVYDTRHPKDDREEYMQLTYDAGGALTKAVRKHIHDMHRRGPVSEEQHKMSFDPLSLFMIGRKQIYQAVQENKPSLKLFMYDGKRLHQWTVKIYGKKLLKRKGEKVGVQKIGIRHTLIAGQTKKEIRRYKNNQVPEATVYFTADQRFLPIYAKQPWIIGEFTAELR